MKDISILLKEEVLNFSNPFPTRIQEEEVIRTVPQYGTGSSARAAPSDQRRGARYVEVVSIRPSRGGIENTDVLGLTEELIEDVLGPFGDLGRRY